MFDNVVSASKPSTSRILILFAISFLYKKIILIFINERLPLNKNIEIEIQLISSKGKVPSQKHASDIGYDISSNDVTLKSNEVTLVNTGIAISLPQQCAGFVLPRSDSQRNTKLLL